MASTYAPEGATFLERAAAVTATTSGIAVVDQQTGMVHQLNATLEADAPFGREGSGPGELLQPRFLRAGSGGSLWVGDASNRRIVRFDRVGQELASFPHPMPVSFALLHDRVIAVGPSPEVPFFDVAQPATPFRWVTPMPDELRSRAPWHPERILIDAVNDSTFVMLDSESARLWLLGIRGEEIATLTPLPMPAWLTSHVLQVKAARLKALRLPAGGSVLMGTFTALHATADGVWVKPQSGAMLGVLVPYEAGAQATVVLPSGGGEQRGLLDSLLIGRDVLVASYATEVRTYRLVPSSTASLETRLAASL